VPSVVWIAELLISDRTADKIAGKHHPCAHQQKEGMMEVVSKDFYLEDEPIEDVKHAWRTGQPVLVLPASFRRWAEKSWLAFRRWAAKEPRRHRR